MSNEVMPTWTHHWATINDIRMHYVSDGDEHGGPVVLLLHGFPHTWFSWRHQISALAAAGYRVIAPDLRGMGDTEAPADPTAYRADVIVADLIALLDHVGAEQAIVSGLDFGMFSGYDLAIEHPERVAALIGLQNPFMPESKYLPSEVELRRAQERFNHMATYFADPDGVVADYEAHTREILTKIFHILSADADFSVVWKNPPGTSYRDAIPTPPQLPWSWLSQWELETYVDAYSRSGFRGGVNWYVAIDDSWRYRQERGIKHTTVPFYFLGSKDDVDLLHFQGAEPLEVMKHIHHGFRRSVTLDGGGHLLVMQRPEDVTRVFVDFLREITAAAQPSRA